MPIGPLMIDIAGTALSDEDKSVILNPLVGGVILFSRNYENVDQLTNLTYSIRELRQSPFLISVDHEGGRVQRFREGFSEIPAMRDFGHWYDKDQEAALAACEVVGWLMAIEVLAAGIDFSFAPVLDLDKSISEIIGDRAFHSEPETVAELAKAFIRGMQNAGMKAIGKHFPGHGSVALDSHTDLPIDERQPKEILEQDLIPFVRLARHHLSGIMPAHVIYQCLDKMPAGFSSFWLDRILRQEAGFTGAILSDDLSMSAAHLIPDVVARTEAALNAGCDMVLICNDRKAALKVLDKLQYTQSPASSQRLLKLCGRFQYTKTELDLLSEWHNAQKLIAEMKKSKSSLEVENVNT